MKNKLIVSIICALSINYFFSQVRLKNEIIKCFSIDNSSGSNRIDTNKSVSLEEISNYPELYGYLNIYIEKTYNSNGKILFQKDENYIKTYSYNNGLLYMRISEKQSDTNQKDTIIYKYNDNDSVSYTYKLPILDKFTYYFDENDRIIPSNKYDYKNEQHSSREIYQVICEEYEYNQEGKIVEIREGKFEVMDNKSIGRMLELESEISFRYYPNGNLKSEQFTNEIYTYTKEWSEDGNQYVQKFRSKFERGERVYIFSCLNGKISKIESMMFPYSNYPTGNKSENTITELIYNDNHLISKIEYTDLLSKNKLTYSFEYKYDAQKNWIEKTIFINGKSKFIEKRELIYFND